MANVIVIYATDYGNTKKMAEALAQGAASVPMTIVTLKEALAVTMDDLTAADAIVLGSPVHMGSMHWKMKKMIDEVCSRLWMPDALVGKVGAVFASGGGFGGAGEGVELAMLSMVNNLVELGMIFVPLPKNTAHYADGGLQWGPYGRSGDHDGKPVGIADSVLEVCTAHGANIARVAQELAGKRCFATPVS
ncbi:MAG: NAD(P)H-dependent oxidoreductase [Desulfobacterota bacterium]|nr:NAD(P)H-dependent oxidoreductase [Thermodesulfobacteriota bacterium]